MIKLNDTHSRITNHTTGAGIFTRRMLTPPPASEAFGVREEVASPLDTEESKALKEKSGFLWERR